MHGNVDPPFHLGSISGLSRADGLCSNLLLGVGVPAPLVCCLPGIGVSLPFAHVGGGGLVRSATHLGSDLFSVNSLADQSKGDEKIIKMLQHPSL